MRWLVALIIVVLALFFYLNEPEPKPIEETFIGPQIRHLQDAQDIEADYLKATKEQQQKMEEELEKATGGG